MNTGSPRPGHDDAPLPAELAAALRGLRNDVPPARDLWPGIAARLEPRTGAPAITPGTTADARPGPPPPAAPRRDGRRRARRRNAGYAVAAALVLAVATTWQLLPVRTATDPAADPANVVATGAAAAAEAPLLRAADAMAREYQGAMREVHATTIGTAGTAAAGATGALAGGGPDGLDTELERSAAEVRAALARDPDALHLFNRLQRIYAHRLALSLRQA